MNDISSKLAGLSPEKRNLLIQKLKQRTGAESAPAPDMKEQHLEINEGENLCCEISAPGNFKALRFRKTLRSEPAAGQIQIEAKAASLNFRDLMIAMNMYPPSPGVPSIMGSDYAGIVTAVGEGVEEFKPGDKVYALAVGNTLPDGSIEPNSHFSRYVNVSELQAAIFPDCLSFEQAASIPTVYLTSYFALCYSAHLQKGERVLIHTATGGVGFSALQIAKSIGAEIYATAGSEEKRTYLRSLGIENPMDSRSAEFAEKIMELTSGKGVDVVLNTLPGENGLKGLEILGYFGRYLQIDKTDTSHNSKLDVGMLKKGLSYSVIDISLFFLQPGILKKMLNELSQHFCDKNFLPINNVVYPIFEIGEALTYMSRSKHIGKIVLKY